MIAMSTIDRQFSLFQNREIYLWGCGFWGRRTMKVLKNRNIPLAGIFDSKESLWGTTQDGIAIGSPSEFVAALQSNPQLLLILGVGSEQMDSVLDTVRALGEVETLSALVLYHMNEMFHMEDFFIQHPEISDFEKQEWMDCPVPTTKLFFRRWISASENPIFICQPPKTGDYTIMATLEEHGVPYYPMWHKSDLFDKALVESLGEDTTIKVICSIREPIIRCLSDLYHSITDFDIFPAGLTDREKGVSFFADGGDVQKLFDRFIEVGGGTHSIHGRWKGTQEKGTYYEQYFDLFQTYILDVRQAPFDQEKGYAIIKQGNIQVFFYQLEKLNDLVKELSEFVGCPLEGLTNANEAKNKWIADSYAQGKEEIKISQDYFESVYHDPYIRHCYSGEDIAKFQKKWKSHLK